MAATTKFLGIGSIFALACMVLAIPVLPGCVTGHAKAGGSTGEAGRDLVYAERNSVPLTGDWHPASSPQMTRKGKAPVCIVIHGGGWYKGDKGDMESVAQRLLRRGIAVFNINYRLAPAHRFPASVLDTKDAIRWIKANANDLGVDPDRVCLFGYSAGAHLALMAGFTGPKEGLDDSVPPTARIFRSGSRTQTWAKLPRNLTIKAIVAGGTPSDLTEGIYNEYYEKYFGRPPGEIPETYRKASPISYIRRGLPPVFLYHGNHDWVVNVEQSRRLAKKLRAKGVDVEYLEVTLGHVATFLFDDKEVNAAIGFLEARL